MTEIQKDLFKKQRGRPRDSHAKTPAQRQQERRARISAAIDSGDVDSFDRAMCIEVLKSDKYPDLHLLAYDRLGGLLFRPEPERDIAAERALLLAQLDSDLGITIPDFSDL